MNTEELYKQFKNITNKTTEDVVGFRKRKPVIGMPQEIEELCKKRRETRLKMLNNPNNTIIRDQYRHLNKEVKKETKACKLKEIEKKVEQMEEDFKKNNSHNLFKMVKELEGKPKKCFSVVKDKAGNKLTDKGKVLKCWEEHFNKHLNTEFSHEPKALDSIICQVMESHTNESFTIEEISTSIKQLKSRKAPGIDEITAEVLKAGGPSMINILKNIFEKVWEEEIPPSDWQKMLVTPIHKKGDKLDPANYRAISLLSIPSKVFCRILLNRIKENVENILGESQFGFREGRGTVDAIFVIRQIMEKANEHKVPIHFHFIDYKAAFDTIWREALWKMLGAIGINPKIVNIFKNLYLDTKCAVVIDGEITNWFSVIVGVRQGCLLSPTLFNIFLEFVMKELKSIQNQMMLKDTASFEIRYADDTTLISCIFAKLQLSTQELEIACKRWGMKINADKCKIITPENGNITIDRKNVNHVSEFVFLGSVVPGTSSDVCRRLSLAAAAFGRLKEPIWSKRNIPTKLKIRLYNALIIPIATYASETWTLKTVDNNKLNTFEMRCLRTLLGVTRWNRIRNEDIRNRLGVKETITETIQKKRLHWFGHVIRRNPNSYVNISYKNDFRNKRPQGRPPKRWTDQIKEDTSLPLLTAERNALQRGRWRGQSNMMCARIRRGLCS